MTVKQWLGIALGSASTMCLLASTPPKILMININEVTFQQMKNIPVNEKVKNWKIFIHNGEDCSKNHSK